MEGILREEEGDEEGVKSFASGEAMTITVATVAKMEMKRGTRRAMTARRWKGERQTMTMRDVDGDGMRRRED